MSRHLRKRFTIENHKVQLVSVKVLLFHMPKWQQLSHQLLHLVKSKAGVYYQSLDMQPAHLFFMIAASEGGAQTHLDALAKLSGILMDENVREKLLHASSPEEVLAIIDHADDEATKEEAELKHNKLQLQNNHLNNLMSHMY